jgi:alpha-ketoglutarate-dependent taurine dioxygenase
MNAHIDIKMLSDVSVQPLLPDRDFPVQITPYDSGCDLVSWAREHRSFIDWLICDAGAVLFRGFDVSRAESFEAAVNAMSTAGWVSYREASTPRSHVGGNLFTATEYPPPFRIYVHNENSHVTSWPLYLFFHCRTAAATGGHTPLADCRAMYQRLPSALVERFVEKGWMYRRNFGPTSSIPWQKTFGTDKREEVERYCRENYMRAEWTPNGLTVRYRRWAALTHPRTGDRVWFNHGTFFNPYTLEPAVKKLYEELGEDALPYNTCYGDGTPIEPETMRILDEAYAAETISFPWQAGDVLMVDNMRLAHGRQPFTGRRQVLVTMKWKIACEEIAPRQTWEDPLARLSIA